MSTSICEWFDPYNIKHIKAYKHLYDTGSWPEGFIPKNVEMVTSWQMLLWSKLANAWVNHMLQSFNTLVE